MPSIRITKFGGMKPKEVRSEYASSRAELARDIKLWHGTAAPWRYPSLEVNTDKDKICSLYKYNCCWVSSENKCADFTHFDTDCNIIYSTGHVDWPAYAILPDNCDTCCYQELQWKRLGIPKPVNAPVIISSDPLTPKVPMPVVSGGNYNCEDPDYCGSKPTADTWYSDAGEQLKREPRSYLYTFVNELGEESSPSDPSEVIDVDINGCVTIGIDIPSLDVGFEVQKIRIYRGLASFGDPKNPVVNPGDGIDFNESVGSDFYFVGEIDFLTGPITYQDCLEADAIGEPIRENCYNPPPECLQGLSVTNTGVLVGYTGKQLWFSEPWKPYAWDCFLNLDHCIGGIKVNGDYIYVATNSYPYLVSTQNNDKECKCCRQVMQIDTRAPISCKSSMVKTGTGAMWATNTGIVKMDGGSITISTHTFLAEDDWQKYFPHQIKATYYKGQYFGFNDFKGFIWDVNDGVYSDSFLGDSTNFTELSITPDSVFVTDQEELFMSIKGDIFRWDNSNTYMPFLWKSNLNVEAGVRNYSAMKIVFKEWLRTKVSPNPVTVRLYADDKLIFQREVSCSRPFRLPKGFSAINFNIEITGIEEVMEIHMATSMKELTGSNNT